MGVAGFACLSFIVCFCKGVYSLIKYCYYKRFGVFKKAEVTKILDVYQEKKRTCFDLEITVQDGDDYYHTKYSYIEDKHSKIHYDVGDTIDVLWIKNRPSYIPVSYKSNIKGYFIVSLISAVILGACILFVYYTA